MSNHTPGNWKMVVAPAFGPEDYEGITIESEDGSTIICDMAGGLPLIEIMGNAQLIEKAPKLLHMLKLYVLFIGNTGYSITPETASDLWLKSKEIISEIERVEPL